MSERVNQLLIKRLEDAEWDPLLQMTPAELASAPIDTKTYLAVSHWQWVMRQASEPPRLAR